MQNKFFFIRALRVQVFFFLDVFFTGTSDGILTFQPLRIMCATLKRTSKAYQRVRMASISDKTPGTTRGAGSSSVDKPAHRTTKADRKCNVKKSRAFRFKFASACTPDKPRLVQAGKVGSSVAMFFGRISRKRMLNSSFCCSENRRARRPCWSEQKKRS